MLGNSRTVVGVFSHQQMKNMVRNQRQQATGDNSKRADTPYSNVLTHWKKVLCSNANVEKTCFTSVPIRVLLNY